MSYHDRGIPRPESPDGKLPYAENPALHAFVGRIEQEVNIYKFSDERPYTLNPERLIKPVVLVFDEKTREGFEHEGLEEIPLVLDCTRYAHAAAYAVDDSLQLVVDRLYPEINHAAVSFPSKSMFNKGWHHIRNKPGSNAHLLPSNLTFGKSDRGEKILFGRMKDLEGSAKLLLYEIDVEPGWEELFDLQTSRLKTAESENVKLAPQTTVDQGLEETMEQMGALSGVDPDLEETMEQMAALLGMRLNPDQEAAYRDILIGEGLDPTEADFLLEHTSKIKQNESKTLPEKIPTQEDYDLFVANLEEGLKEMNVLPDGQKFDPAKVFHPETKIQDHYGNSSTEEYLERFGISNLPFLFYGDVSSAKQVKVNAEFERDYSQLVISLPQINFFSLENSGNGPCIKKRFYDSSFQLKPEAVPVGTRENSEYVIVIGPVPNKLFAMRMGSVEESKDWQNLFKDGKLVDRKTLPKGDLFERAKKQVDRLSPYSGTDIKVEKGTKQAVLNKGIHVRATTTDQSATFTLTGLNSSEIKKWLESNPSDLSNLPKGGVNDNDHLSIDVDSDHKISACIYLLNSAFKREGPVKVPGIEKIESVVMLSRLLQGLKDRPSTLARSGGIIYERNKAPRKKRQPDNLVREKAWEKANEPPKPLGSSTNEYRYQQRVDTPLAPKNETSKDRKAKEEGNKRSLEAQNNAQKAKFKADKARKKNELQKRKKERR